MTPLWHRFHRLGRTVLGDDRGMPLIEFAIALPLLILLSLGVIEVGLYSLIGLKLQSSVSNLGNLVTRGPDLSQADIDDIFESARSNMAPFGVGPNTAFVVTSVAADPNVGAEVSWQRSGAGSLGTGSRVGAAGAAATVPSDIGLQEATLIVVEGFYAYQETLFGLVPSTTVYRVAYHRPRFGPLDTPQ